MTDPFPQPDQSEDAADFGGLRCLRCQEEMNPGFQFDTGPSAIQVARWVPGLPQKAWLSGEVKSSQAKQGLPITIFRCPRCGYLESYAI